MEPLCNCNLNHFTDCNSLQRSKLQCMVFRSYIPPNCKCIIVQIAKCICTNCNVLHLTNRNVLQRTEFHWMWTPVLQKALAAHFIALNYNALNSTEIVFWCLAVQCNIQCSWGCTVAWVARECCALKWASKACHLHSHPGRTWKENYFWMTMINIEGMIDNVCNSFLRHLMIYWCERNISDPKIKNRSNVIF